MTPQENLPYADSQKNGLELLAPLRVLDLTTSIAGPYATQLLADLGATVLKVEKPGAGDDTRAWGPPFLQDVSLWYLSVNRNKHSLTLDVSQPEGREVLDGLLAQSDVLVLNMVPRVQRKLGLDYDSLKAAYPALIHASLTGFGLTGPRSDFPCYDLIAEGYAGIMDLTGELESAPQKVGTPAADLLAGQDLALAVLAAYIARGQHGRGTQIDISMQSSMTRFVSPRLLPYLGSGELPRRSGGKDSVIAIYQVFGTADDPLSLGLGNDRIWQRFWQAVGDPAFGARAEFASNAHRRTHREAIVTRIAELLRAQPRAHWLALFAEHSIPAGPINRLDQVAQDPDLLDKGLIYRARASNGAIPQVGLGIGFDGSQHVHRKSPPALGEDTDDVLRGWLGYAGPRIDALRERGVI
ncbi:CoA transferase [Achromobacter sp. ACM01]|uniref:CaiB/BaiF CoA transferase family protein n=1 Tax=Achromobacter sp. ACM01 TaxID=2769298 RepID=UPI00177C377E|nr:CoA transferase [Achromobacter sp. ACM01]MBD9472068.1 CoA transferase [Achromobacter sp. ACM01]